ncbi:T9SS type A sorting domain-containing protein [Halocola ammonii]
MKKPLLFLAAVFAATFSYSQTILLNEDFESYNPGDLIAEQSADFTTWSGTEGGNEDAPVSDDLAASGSNSLKFEASSVQGGPTDIFMPLGVETGTYAIQFKIFVPSDAAAYFNMQTTTTPGDGWAWDIYMDQGSLSLQVQGTEQASTSFNHDEWITVTIIVSMDNDEINFVINEEPLGSIPYVEPVAGGINFFAYGGETTIGLYYIDDVNVVDTTVGIEENEKPEFTVYPNPASDVVKIDASKLQNGDKISAFDLTGKKVFESTVGSDLIHEIAVDDWQRGMYFFQIVNKKGTTTKRLVVR